MRVYNPEWAQLLVPVGSGGYVTHYFTLLGFDKPTQSMLMSLSGAGMVEHHFNTQRGPFQDGETPIDMRWDVNIIELQIAQEFIDRFRYFDEAWLLADAIRPNRSFDLRRQQLEPLILRYWLPGGKHERATDLVTTAGSTVVTSRRGRFVHWGLEVGDAFDITSGPDAGPYTITAVDNDYTLRLDVAPAASNADIGWRYRRGQGIREKYFLLESGPQYRQPSDFFPQGSADTLRFIAHDPFWYGDEQQQTWEVDEAFGGLIFKGSGATFGTGGTGSWIFGSTSFSEAASVVYWGHEVALPVVTITGPATNPRINNVTIGTQLNLAYTVAAGETVTIDVANLTVTNNFGANLSSVLGGDLANFSISPPPQAPNRINTITMNFINPTLGVTNAMMTWKNKYVVLG